MSEQAADHDRAERIKDLEEMLRVGATAAGTATFEWRVEEKRWRWSPYGGALFGFPPDAEDDSLQGWEQVVFADDLLKLRTAAEEALASGSFSIEFRVRHPDASVHWIAAKGIALGKDSSHRLLRGACFEITERKALEARLLALNETLEARVTDLREESRTLEVLNDTGVALAAEHDLERLVQIVTDAGVAVTHAQFGALFHNTIRDDGEAYVLYTLSGAPREAFSKFPMPRNTAVFGPTFAGRAPVRSADILRDPRYGKSAPYHGMPEGHLPVRSYLAVSVVSRSGEVLGGLFFGHSQPDVFTERAERIITALAAQAAVAMDNALLFASSRREITARTEVEEQLQQLNNTLEQRAEQRARELAVSLTKLEDTERRFKLLVEGVTDYAIYMLDPSGTIVNWNAGARRIKGYSREDIIGRHFSTFYTTEDREMGVPQKALAIAAQTGKYEAEGWRIRKDETRFWASVVINAIKAPDGSLLGFAKITRDMTEKRAAAELLQQAQKMESIGRLTGGVAHDFNNLLTVIVGNLSTLQRGLSIADADTAKLRRSADNAMRGARRAESLVQRLLAFSRQQPLDPKPIDLGRLVSGMSDLLRRTLGEAITVESVLGGGLWSALADPNQLELAILNLAVNARDAMPDGGRLTIETANVHLDEKYAASQVEVLPGQYVMVAVTDSGTGMTPEVKARAFDPFFTTKAVGHGTGLGLSQVYGFVKQSRGHVKIYSELGEGTTIKLYLPRAHSVSSWAEEDDQELQATGAQNETILLVEDDADVRAFGSESLRELGYTVLEAENGQSALKLLDSNRQISLLFTDVGLPGGMNGRELSQQARTRRPGLKVLFTTGYARNAIVHNGRLDPGVELIAKPFTQAALALRLRDILDAKRIPGRILLVEDEPLIQMLATEFLEEAGFSVDLAGSALEAMNKLGRVPGGADAAVVDVGLPDRQGDALVRELRAIHSTLPIVVATGQDATGLAREMRYLERIAFVSKPYTASDLLEALASLGIRGNTEGSDISSTQ